MSQNLSSAIAAIGIDIGKNSFHVFGLDARGAILLRQKWSRGQRRPASEHAAVFDRHGGVCWRASPQSQAQGVWSRRAADAGEVCAPLFEGAEERFPRRGGDRRGGPAPHDEVVATKTAEQLDLQALHRVRAGLVSQRTGIINQIRAFLLDRGVAIRQGLRFLRAELPRILTTLPDVRAPRMVCVIEGLAEDWRRLDERISYLSDEIAAPARQDAGCERLVSVPGIGPIISSAMVAAIGTGETFSKGGYFAAWLGLVPKQISICDRTILGSISKRGNRYLRMLFVQAAWVVLIKPKS
jgi:transposase